MSIDTVSETELKILILEVEPADAEVVERTLREGGLKFVSARAANRQELLDTLDKFKPEVVLSAYKLPDLEGISALKLIREKYSDLPVIGIASEIGDRTAVELIKAGINDYLLKDRLARLPSAVRRAITEAEERRALAQVQLRLQEAARYSRSLIEASLDPLVTINSEGKITDVNEATVRATGVARGTLIGTDFANYFTEPHKARASYREVYAKGFVTNYPLSIRHASGTVTDVLYNASLYRDEKGEVTGVFAAARDITTLKRTEEELHKYRQHLEELVTLRTADLKMANEKLKAVNKELESFSYSVSHDLRVPIRAIDGFSRILLEDYSSKLDAEGQRLLNVVRDSTVKMAWLIDDIIAFAQAGRAEMTPARIDMDGLVRAVLVELESVQTGRKLTFDIKPLASAQGDAAMVRRIWSNLIDNAVKFTAPKPEAVIEVGSTVGHGETIYFVKDNGAGFDMQYANKLFGVFQRLHGVEFAGTGTGLAIVKRIVGRHGGRVWAEGKVNEGATFYFSLPVQENSHD